MTQRDRDRLVALKKANNGLITQREAAAEIGQSERHVRRLLRELRAGGDAAVVHHQLRGRPSNRKLDDKVKSAAIRILSRKVYAGFGPTVAAEYLAARHHIQAGRETVRKWMIQEQLWRAKKQRIDKIHQWRQRRAEGFGFEWILSLVKLLRSGGLGLCKREDSWAVLARPTDGLWLGSADQPMKSPPTPSFPGW